mgnify:CR=1 FL=1
MRRLLFLMVAMVTEVAFGSIDVSGTVNVHADAEALTAFVSVLGAIVTLVKCSCLHKHG